VTDCLVYPALAILPPPTCALVGLHDDVGAAAEGLEGGVGPNNAALQPRPPVGVPQRPGGEDGSRGGGKKATTMPSSPGIMNWEWVMSCALQWRAKKSTI